MAINPMIRVQVRSLYDMQKLRIQAGNRLVAAYRVKLGIQPSQIKKGSEDKEAEKLLESLRLEYSRITDGIKKITRKTKIDSPLISDLSELMLIEAYERQLLAEEAHVIGIEVLLKNEPIWVEFLEKVKGCGTMMSGVILSEFDIHKAKYPSSLWKYAGLDVAPNDEGVWEGRSKRRYHLVPKTYTRRDGTVTDTVGTSYNPMLKTKLVGVLAGCLLKANDKYKEVYDGYKHRLENHPIHSEKTKAHRHNMAKRYMIKVFLQDLYNAWRAIEGLPITPTYAEAKLGLRHAA